MTRGSYVGAVNCTNPLFAAALPDGSALDQQSLCNLPVGFSRTPDRVFLLTIGGVPNQLLHYVPADPGSTMLSAGDWTKILGNDPESYDFTGIDPHMIPSYLPRPGLPLVSPPSEADVVSGREWITNSRGSVDLESACVFPLAIPRDCSKPENSLSCSCPRALVIFRRRRQRSRLGVILRIRRSRSELEQYRRHASSCSRRSSARKVRSARSVRSTRHRKMKAIRCSARGRLSRRCSSESSRSCSEPKCSGFEQKKTHLSEIA